VSACVDIVVVLVHVQVSVAVLLLLSARNLRLAAAFYDWTFAELLRGRVLPVQLMFSLHEYTSTGVLVALGCKMQQVLSVHILSLFAYSSSIDK
jgi:hypothetical protein